MPFVVVVRRVPFLRRFHDAVQRDEHPSDDLPHALPSLPSFFSIDGK
jgi:hypothetical protein